MSFDLTGKNIFVAGETGMVGRAMLRALSHEDVTILSAPHRQLDLTDKEQTLTWLNENKPDVIVMAAGKVGGIGANAADPKGFYNQNKSMAENIIHGAYEVGVEKLLYLGSSCIYPKMAKQPIKEEALLTGALEPTNEAYALAKIAGLQLCEFYNTTHGKDFISAMPCNLYGPHDHFDKEKSHVIPALFQKFYEAKESGLESVTLWGTGTALREFSHVDDLAEALVLLLKDYNGAQHINVGSGEEINISDLAREIKDIVGFRGEIIFDDRMPDGTPRKLLDNSKINAMGWTAKTPLKEGLLKTYQWYLENKA